MSKLDKQLSSFEKISGFIRETAFILGLLIMIIGGWYQLQSDIRDSKVAVQNMKEENDEVKTLIEGISARTNENTTSVKVLETQLEILRGGAR